MTLVRSAYSETVPNFESVRPSLESFERIYAATGGTNPHVDITYKWGGEHFIKYSWEVEL